MPTTNARGLPLYNGAPGGDTMPGWAAGYNAQSNALATALDDSEAAAKAADSVATVAALPEEDNWVGRLILVEENTTVYVCTALPATWGVLGGPTLPSFRAVGSSSHATSSTITTITEWDTPEKNVGFAGWASGVLTIDKAGDYLISGTLRGVSTQVQVILYVNGAEQQFGAAGGLDSVMTTLYPLAVDDTIELRAYSATPTATQPDRASFTVRYLGT